MVLILDGLRMIGDIRGLGGWIGVWGGALNIPQVLGGLLFIGTPEGAAILVTVVLTLVIAGQIHKRQRFSRLTGLCHVPWLALLPWLIWRIATVDHGPVMTLWLAYVGLAILISLIFDIFDVARYLRGDRTFAWAN
jgi:hypothetical protein